MKLMLEKVDQLQEWTKRLQASDAEALAEVFDALHTPLIRYALRLLRNDDAAHDVVQEAFIKLWLVRETLDSDRSIRALLYTIVRNLSFNAQRLRNRRQEQAVQMEPTNMEEHPMIEEEIDTQKLADLLHEWIDSLPPRRREAFQLSRFDGHSHEAIAEIMNLTPRTVTNHIMLALQHLRDRLHQYRASEA